MHETSDDAGVQVGDPAPDFTLPDQHGELVTLSHLLGEQAVVLYFYPKDDTSICTREARRFRDSYEVFRDAGAEVLGVSSDGSESHLEFATRHQLPFRLLSDRGSWVRHLYGVRRTLGLIPGRVTYVIDRAGQVRHAFSSQLDALRHVKEALAVIRELAGGRDLAEVPVPQPMLSRGPH